MAQKIIQPIGNKLLVLPSEAKEQKSETSNIIIPETANANLTEGVVIEASKEIEHLIKVGDTVVFSSGSGVGYFYKGKPSLWLQIHEIWGNVTKEAV